MHKKDFKPGTEVVASVDNSEWDDCQIVKFYFSECDDFTIVGKVLDKHAKEGHVFVLWDENEHDYEEEEMNVDLLTLASDLPKIEVEFKACQDEIKNKMKEAASLVNEAGKLAHKAHAKSLESMWEACRPLISAMDKNGWNSSSWGC